ncbi:hypothetical protein V1517DRAFT_322823 [Lipomyces orientalis]|uniref:Uncharacterized protein n=1 Tax=Lipomyces orientalis TaxID=1233043 RepID=A0ACC3TNT5_9ASCO
MVGSIPVMQGTSGDTLDELANPSSLTVPEIAVEESQDVSSLLDDPPKRHVRHVSFDEQQNQEVPANENCLSPNPGHSRWSVRRQWGRSPSPGKVRVASADDRSPSPRPRKSAEETGSFMDDQTQSAKSSTFPQDEKKTSSANAYRYLFRKNFNPDEPETDDERRVRERLHEVLKFIRKQRICMMTSQNAKGYLVASAVVVAEVENGVDFVFHANRRTLKVEDIDDNPNINLSFQNSETAEWVSIAGTAKISNDIDDIDRYLRTNLKNWVGSQTDLGGKNIGIVHLRTRSIAYSVSDDFTFVPTSQQNGIVRGEIQYSNGTVKIDESQIKQFRRRYKHTRQRTPSRSRTE